MNAANTQVRNVEISSQVDRSEITIGDRILYEVKVIFPKDGKLELPSVLGNMGSFEVKDYQVSEPKAADNLLIQTWHLNLSTFTVGKYTLPPQQVVYRHGNDTNATIYFTQPIEINVVRTSAETIKDIADIAALAEQNSRTPWLTYGLGSLVLIALAIIGWKWLRKNKRLATIDKPPLPPFEEAMEKLSELKGAGLIRLNQSREYCFILSELLRKYISRRFSIDALESTTSEFLILVRKLPITAAQKQTLVEFCERTDIVKYADAGLLESDADQLCTLTEGFLRQTKPQEVTEKK